MRVLFTTKPGYGSFQPLGPLARALIAAGHEVTFAASATFCRVLERAGFRCLPAGLDFSMDDRDRVYDDIRRTLGPTTAPFSAVRDVFAGFLAPRMVPDLLAIAEAWPSACRKWWKCPPLPAVLWIRQRARNRVRRASARSDPRQTPPSGRH